MFALHHQQWEQERTVRDAERAEMQRETRARKAEHREMQLQLTAAIDRLEQPKPLGTFNPELQEYHQEVIAPLQVQITQQGLTVDQLSNQVTTGFADNRAAIEAIIARMALPAAGVAPAAGAPPSAPALNPLPPVPGVAPSGQRPRNPVPAGAIDNSKGGAQCLLCKEWGHIRSVCPHKATQMRELAAAANAAAAAAAQASQESGGAPP